MTAINTAIGKPMMYTSLFSADNTINAEPSRQPSALSFALLEEISMYFTKK